MTEYDTSGSAQPESEDQLVEVPENEVELDSERPDLEVTDDDIADGNHLGEVIDVNDDTDTGARESYL